MSSARYAVGQRVEILMKCSADKPFSWLLVAFEIMNHLQSEYESTINSSYLCAQIKLTVRYITDKFYEVDLEASNK